MAVQQAPGRDVSGRILKVIKEGMDVYDRQGKKIGKVTDIYFGASSTETEKHGTGAATAPAPDMRGDTLVDEIAKTFAPEKLPQELHDQLRRNGFVKIEGGGLFSRAKYILPNQIDSAVGNRVDLRVNGDGLIQRGS
jgi:hypothetical protein